MSRMPPTPKKASLANQAGRTSAQAIAIALELARAVKKEPLNLTPQREAKLQRDATVGHLFATISMAQANLALSRQVAAQNRQIARLMAQMLGGDATVLPAELGDEDEDMAEIDEQELL